MGTAPNFLFMFIVAKRLAILGTAEHLSTVLIPCAPRTLGTAELLSLSARVFTICTAVEVFCDMDDEKFGSNYCHQ